MISKSKVKLVLCDGVFVFNYFKTMYNKTIIRFGFCDIQNNQGLGRCYQPWPSELLISLLQPWLFRINYHKLKHHPIIILFIIMHYYYLNFDWLPILPGTTCRVEPVLSGHPSGMAEWPLNTGWPPNTDCKKDSSKNLISSADLIRRLTSNRNIYFWHFNFYYNNYY